MPIYEYRCRECDHAFDHLARTLSDAATACPKCGSGEIEKQWSAFSTATKSPGTPCGIDSCPSAQTCGPDRCASGRCPMSP